MKKADTAESEAVLPAAEVPPEAEAKPLNRARVRAPSLYAVAAFAVLAAIFIFALAPRFDPDFWWHLKDGQYISLHHVVPSHDFMTYVFLGHSWTDHEWLPELVMYGLYRLAGLEGPVFFFALVITATFALVYAAMVLREINRGIALILLIVGAVASTGSWGPRVQMLTLLFLAAYALILFRFETTRDRRVLVALPVVMLFWANSHGGFVLGLGLLAVTLVGELLNHRVKRDGAFSADDLKALSVALLASLAVTLINPNGFRQVIYPLTFLLPNPFTNLIQESASPDFHLFIMSLFEVLLLLTLLSFYVGRRRVNWSHVLIVLAFTHLALVQERNVPVWVVVVTPILALYVQEMLGWSYRPKRLAGGVKSVINTGFILLILIAVIRGGAYVTSAKTINTFESKSFPAGAVAYMKTHALPPHVFVNYEWGGYMLWHLFPRYRDYMDSRADTLFTARILNDYLTMYEAQPGWKGLLNRYSVQDVLIKRKAALAQVLTEDPGWQRVFNGSEAVLYVRAGQ